jgi:serine/threonine protein kinase
VATWLSENPASKAASVERQLLAITAVLHDHCLLHMDGHFGNMRVDGERIYLTDFGLATSPHFDLSTAERDFARRHAMHDTDYAAMRLVNWLVTEVCGVAVSAGTAPVARDEYVARCATGDIPVGVPPAVTAILARHAPAAARMNALYRRLFGGDMRAEYPGR